VPIKFWVMDLNPDQAIQLGIIKEKSLVARIFTWFNRVILRRAVDVVALDRFMAERLNRKVDASAKMHVMPPWPHDAHLDSVPLEKNPFRNAHGLDGKFVVMYSGNHGLTTPVRTVLRAALSLRQRDDIVFMFIGGGLGKKDVERTIAEHNPPNVRSLPYQPMDQLRYSLSAADVHLVTMSDGLVGIIHPCKIYGAMRIGRPVLFIGPTPSHASDLLDEGQCGWHVKDEDDKATAALIERIVAMPKAELAAMGQRGARLIDDKYSMARLRTAFCDVVEKGLPPVPALAPDAAAARAINRSGDVHSAA
jgi:glycosyltransferase involved in cell wall biosynthesis